MDIIFVILLIFIFVFFYFYQYNGANPNSNTYVSKEKFENKCWTYGDDYNSCYSNSNCTIGFLPDGSTQCMKKFLQEDI